MTHPDRAYRDKKGGGQVQNPRNDGKSWAGSGTIETAPEGVGTTSQGLTKHIPSKENVMAVSDSTSPATRTIGGAK